MTLDVEIRLRIALKAETCGSSGRRSADFAHTSPCPEDQFGPSISQETKEAPLLSLGQFSSLAVSRFISRPFVTRFMAQS